MALMDSQEEGFAPRNAPRNLPFQCLRLHLLILLNSLLFPKKSPCSKRYLGSCRCRCRCRGTAETPSLASSTFQGSRHLCKSWAQTAETQTPAQPEPMPGGGHRARGRAAA